MKKKTLLALSAVPLTLLLSSCFVLQGFWVTSTSIRAGQTTKAVFKIHAYSTAKDKGYQFVVVGVPNGGDLKAQKTTWGTNGKAGGPYAMAALTPLPAAISASGDCSSNGFDFSSVTGITWKGYMTPNPVNDKGKVNTAVIVQTKIKATAAADTGLDYQILGVTGKWLDDGDGTVNASDSFFCTGFGLSNLYVT